MHRTIADSGRFVRSAPVREGERHYDIAVDATLRAALTRVERSSESGRLEIENEDLRKKVYKRPQKTLIVFLVDSSDSMGGEGTYARIRAAKGAVLAILAKAYQKRHRVGMISFREESAEVILAPTTSLDMARKKLKALPTGGTTPLADGLMTAWRMIRVERIKDPMIRPLLVLLSDGEANVPYAPGCPLTEVQNELFTIAGRIGRDKIHSISIDTRPLRNPSPNMKRVAEMLGGEYEHISRLKADGMVRKVVGFQYA